jgi:hypothetical protein
MIPNMPSISGKRSDILASLSGSQADGVMVNLEDEAEKHEPSPSVKALREMFGYVVESS